MKSKYAMTETQVESLAHDIANAQGVARVGGLTYLRVLVTECQFKLGRVKRGRPTKHEAETQLAVLTDASAKYYAAVLRGVTTPDIAPADGLEPAEASRRALERNRRSTFARSAKSVLMTWVKNGGDLRALDPETVTRDPLAADVRKARGGNETAHRIDRNLGAIVRLVMTEARGDPDAAREDVERCMEELQRVLDELSANGNKAEPAPAPEPGITTIIGRRAPHLRQPAPSSRVHA